MRILILPLAVVFTLMSPQSLFAKKKYKPVLAASGFTNLEPMIRDEAFGKAGHLIIQSGSEYFDAGKIEKVELTYGEMHVRTEKKSVKIHFQLGATYRGLDVGLSILPRLQEKSVTLLARYRQKNRRYYFISLLVDTD